MFVSAKQRKQQKLNHLLKRQQVSSLVVAITIIIINVYLSMSTYTEYKGATIKKMMHSS